MLQFKIWIVLLRENRQLLLYSSRVCFFRHCCGIRSQFLTKADIHDFGNKIIIYEFYIDLILKISNKHNFIYFTTHHVTITYIFRHKFPIIRLHIKIEKLKNYFLKSPVKNVEFSIVVVSVR